MQQQTSEIKPGKYKHYKGNFYQVEGVARHSETEEQYVVYRPLYGNKEDGHHALWIRPLEMFMEHVEIEGKYVQRFERVGEN